MTTDIDQISKNLLNYLRQQLDNSAVEYVEPLTQLQGGFETQTYRFQLSQAETLTQPLVLRLYPEFYSSSNAIWESTIQNVLHAEGFPVAKAHLLCEDLTILGGAFFIMDHMPGNLMIFAPLEKLPFLLGSTHASLHQIDPAPVMHTLGEHGIQKSALLFDNRFNSFIQKLKSFPALTEAADWLIDNKPPAPETLAICHGDFHPLNILVQDEKVTAVLDWPGLVIGDPVLDVATTILLSTIPFKHLAPSLGMDITGVDFSQFVTHYLNEYQATKPLDTSNLAYYRVRRCVNALREGLSGQQLWQHPLIVAELIEYIHSVTEIQITMPS